MAALVNVGLFIAALVLQASGRSLEQLGVVDQASRGGARFSWVWCPERLTAVT